MADERKYELDLGAKQTLEAVLPSLPSLVDGWMEQVKSGQIDEQFRSIAVALGWITQRDSRVRRATRPRPVKEDRLMKAAKATFTEEAQASAELSEAEVVETVKRAKKPPVTIGNSSPLEEERNEP